MALPIVVIIQGLPQSGSGLLYCLSTANELYGTQQAQNENIVYIPNHFN